VHSCPFQVEADQEARAAQERRRVVQGVLAQLPVVQRTRRDC
jgi:hypothetical protein